MENAKLVIVYKYILPCCFLFFLWEDFMVFDLLKKSFLAKLFFQIKCQWYLYKHPQTLYESPAFVLKCFGLKGKRSCLTCTHASEINVGVLKLLCFYSFKLLL